MAQSFCEPMRCHLQPGELLNGALQLLLGKVDLQPCSASAYVPFCLRCWPVLYDHWPVLYDHGERLGEVARCNFLLPAGRVCTSRCARSNSLCKPCILSVRSSCIFSPAMGLRAATTCNYQKQGLVTIHLRKKSPGIRSYRTRPSYLSIEHNFVMSVAGTANSFVPDHGPPSPPAEVSAGRAQS